MKKFTLLYLLSIILLFTLFYWNDSLLSNTINQWQIDLSALLTSFTLAPEVMDLNRIFVSPKLTLVIDQSCNGLIPYYFFLASIIAFPSSIKHKILWAILGYVLLSLLNVFRIWFITKFVTYSESNFTFAHDYLGNIFLVFSGLALFIAFIKTRKTI